MDFSLTDDQRAIQDAIGRICAGFGDDYWLKKDREGGFPTGFYDALAREGWLGICTAEAQGGAGLGVTEATIAADRADLGMGFRQLAAIDLAGRDVMDAVDTSVNPRTLECPPPGTNPV